MTSRPKQIIIDKSAFQATNLNDLCDFAKHHFLVAPGVLLYECATSPDRERRKLLHRYETLIREGACCCPHGQEFARWEAEHCRPYPSDLATAERVTEKICRGRVRLDDLLKRIDAHQWECSRTREATAKYIELSEAARRRVVQNCPNGREEIKGFPPDRSARLSFILGLIATGLDIHDMAVRSLPPDYIKNEGQFCLSDEWMTWHRMRLGSAIAYEYSYWRLKHGNTPDETHAEHDDQDGEYVLLLSRGDAIITAEGEERGLVPHLARAAFPEKDVFSSLDEVPESYRCD